MLINIFLLILNNFILNIHLCILMKINIYLWIYIHLVIRRLI